MIRTISRWVAATTVCAGLSVAVSQAIVWGVPSCPHGHSALCRASCRHVGSVTLPDRPRRVERGEEAADDRFHTEYGTPATALRPPPSAPRPTHRRHDRRHGPRHPSLNGVWLAGRGADGRWFV